MEAVVVVNDQGVVVVVVVDSHEPMINGSLRSEDVACLLRKPGWRLAREKLAQCRREFERRFHYLMYSIWTVCRRRARK